MAGEIMTALTRLEARMDAAMEAADRNASEGDAQHSEQYARGVFSGSDLDMEELRRFLRAKGRFAEKFARECGATHADVGSAMYGEGIALGILIGEARS